MVRVDTSGVATQVVNNHVVRDGTVAKSRHVAMNEDLVPTLASYELAVAFAVGVSCPFMAIINLLGAGPEPFGCFCGDDYFESRFAWHYVIFQLSGYSRHSSRVGRGSLLDGSFSPRPALLTSDARR